MKRPSQSLNEVPDCRRRKCRFWNRDPIEADWFDCICYVEERPSIRDEQVLAIANENEVLLLTEDKDFGELVFRLQLPHRGILLIRIADAEQKIESVARTIAKYHAELLDKFSVINANKLRVKE